MPSSLFAAGQPRWIAVSIERAPESTRVPLLSVPYAMKAADAQTLAGMPAAAFVTQGQMREATTTAAAAAAEAAANPDAITGTGTAGALAYWTSATALGNSAIVQTGTTTPTLGVNLGALAPLATFDVGGTVNARNNLSLNGNTKATATAGVTSPALVFTANAFATGGTTANQNFSWHAVPVGNDTASPSAKLAFGYGTGATTTDTALSIAPSGVISFVPAQKFPGTGTITDITTTSPLTGGGSSSAVALGLNLPALKTTLNSSYAQLGAANTLTGNQTITGNLTVSGTVFGQGKTGTTGVSGATSSTTNGAAGVTGAANAATGTVYGVSGSTNSTTTNAAGVWGYQGATTGQVFGVSGGTNSTTNYAAAVNGYEGATKGQVYGVSGGTGSATNGAAGVSGNENAATGTVYGVSGSANSTTGNAAGVWGYQGATTGQVFGVSGGTNSTTNYAAAVNGYEGAAKGQVYGVSGGTGSVTNGAAGVSGNENATTGTVYGVSGSASSTTGNAAGVWGYEGASTGQVFGVSGGTNSIGPNAAAVSGYEGASTGSVYGVNGSTNSTGPYAAGVSAYEGATSGVNWGVNATSNSAQGIGVQGSSPNEGIAGFAQLCSSSGCAPTAGTAGLFATGSGGYLLRGLSAPTGTANPAYTQVFSVGATGNGYFAAGVSGNVSNGTGVYGLSSATSGEGNGVMGEAKSPNAIGIRAQNDSTTGGGGLWAIASSSSGTSALFTNASGGGNLLVGNSGSGCDSSTGKCTTVFTIDASGNETLAGNLNVSGALGFSGGLSGSSANTANNSAGVSGNENAITGIVYGVSGTTSSTTQFAAGVNGYEGATTGQVFGVQGSTNSTTDSAAGVSGFEGSATGAVIGVQGGTNSATAGAAGVSGFEGATTGQVSGVNGSTNSTTDQAAGVTAYEGGATGNTRGLSANVASTGGYAVYGDASADSGFTVGVFGDNHSAGGVGVLGKAQAAGGIGGEFVNTAGSGYLVVGQSGSKFTQVFSVDASGNGVFAGNLQVKGTLSKGGGSFKIDDPLDPAHKYLSHSFVESPDMMNVYNGNIVTDKRGYATVVLPEYFEALNRDFRYQLTVMGQFAQAIVAHKVDHNRFVIRTSKPNVEVSWQVTGIRQDAWANANRIPVEEDKPASEQGHYLHPELFGAPASKSIAAAARTISPNDAPSQ
ncbi:MAG TPA: hypothetical protein VMD29_06045 [Terracidiphilus sp.]|nr:hypothetical protein [Terracidiphilus sp.]